MDPKKLKALTVREFNKAAMEFDGKGAGVYALCRKDYPDILEELRKAPFTDLLDCGCGTGAMLALLSRAYPEKRFTGIDIAPGMIREAEKKKLKGVRFVTGDCEALPFPDASFDAVICSMSFHHYPDPLKFLKSVRRVLRPGGRFILREMTGPAPVVRLANRVGMPLLNRLFKKGDVRGYTADDVSVLFRKAGLVPAAAERRKGMRLHAVAVRPESAENRPGAAGIL